MQTKFLHLASFMHRYVKPYPYHGAKKNSNHHANLPLEMYSFTL